MKRYKIGMNTVTDIPMVESAPLPSFDIVEEAERYLMSMPVVDGYNPGIRDMKTGIQVDRDDLV